MSSPTTSHDQTFSLWIMPSADGPQVWGIGDDDASAREEAEENLAADQAEHDDGTGAPGAWSSAAGYPVTVRISGATEERLAAALLAVAEDWGAVLDSAMGDDDDDGDGEVIDFAAAG